MSRPLDTRDLLFAVLARQIANSGGGGGGAIAGPHPALANPATLQALADNLDAVRGFRPFTDDGSVPATLFVNTDTGNDDNDGSSAGQAVATLARALQFCPVWPTQTRVIEIDGAAPADLPSTTALLNRITLRGTRGAVTAGTITGIGATSRAAGLQVTTSLGALTVGDLVEFTSGALAGEFGRVYAVSGAISFITQSTLTWIAPAPGDTFEVIPTPTEIRAPATGAPALTSSHQLRFEDLRFTDAAPDTVLGLATDSIVFDRCRLELRTLIAGRGGSVALNTCFVENTGNAFNLRGLVQVPTGGVLTLTRGTVITGSAASSSAVAHISLITEGVLEVVGEVVADQLGDEGVLCLGAEVVAKRDTIGPEPTWRFVACDQGWRFNPGTEAVGGSADLPDTFGAVTAGGSFVVAAQRGAYVTLGAGSSCSSASGVNAVSADGGASASAVNADQTRIAGGVPGVATGTGGPTRTVWFASDLPQVEQNYQTRSIGATGSRNWTFAIPLDFGELVSLEAIGIPSAGAAGAARDIDFNSNYALVGEAITANAESDTGTLYDLTGTSGEFFAFDVSVVFSALQPGHICGLEIDHNGIGGNIEYVGIRLVYTPSGS